MLWATTCNLSVGGIGNQEMHYKKERLERKTLQNTFNRIINRDMHILLIWSL
jgi:hypothetical protein